MTKTIARFKVFEQGTDREMKDLKEIIELYPKIDVVHEDIKEEAKTKARQS